VKNEAVASTIATLLSSALRSGNGARQLSPSAPTRLVVLVVDVVPPVLECGALPDASSPFLSAPPAGALGAKYLRRIEAQPQITDPDLVLDSHAESVGRRTSPCDQRNKLLGSQRAAGRTGGNRSRPRCASTSWRRIEARHAGPRHRAGCGWPRYAAGSWEASRRRDLSGDVRLRVRCMAYPKGARCSRGFVRCSTAGSGDERDRAHSLSRNA
jgi:hypothetical protein